MVAGLDLALAVRPLRDQSRENILVQAKGIHYLTACNAIAEAGTTLNTLLDRSVPRNGSGDLPPSGLEGRIAVLGEQYVVTYTMASGVLVALVTSPSASIFVCLDVLAAAVRLMASVLRSSHLTPAKVTARFADVYLALDDLLATGLDRLPPGFRHAPPDTKFRFSVPVSRADARRQLRLLMRGKRASAASSSAAGDATTSHGDESAPPEDGQLSAPSLATQASPLHDVSFAIAPGALPPPPARALRHAPTAPRAAARAAPVEQAPIAFAGAVPEPVAAEEAAVAEPADDTWATFADDSRPVTGDLGTEEEEQRAREAAEAAAAAAPPPVTEEDVRASLQLVEVWRGRVTGGQLVEAGIEGAVRRRLAPYWLERTRFCLRSPGANEVTEACLRQVGVSTAYTEGANGGDDGQTAPSWSAVFVRAPADTRYLRYHLPAIAVPPPLEADLRLLPGSGGVALCVLRWVAAPTLAAPGLFDLCVRLALPHGVTLRRASHSVDWKPDTCEAGLVLENVAPGEAGTLCLALDVAELQGATATASIAFTGPVGTTLSGARLDVGLERGKALPGQAVFFGQLDVTV